MPTNENRPAAETSTGADLRLELKNAKAGELRAWHELTRKQEAIIAALGMEFDPLEGALGAACAARGRLDELETDRAELEALRRSDTAAKRRAAADRARIVKLEAEWSHELELVSEIKLELVAVRRSEAVAWEHIKAKQAAFVQILGIPLMGSEGPTTAAERARSFLDRFEAGVAAVFEVLTAEGCGCDCDHSATEHEPTCSRCLGCRVEAALDLGPGWAPTGRADRIEADEHRSSEEQGRRLPRSGTSIPMPPVPPAATDLLENDNAPAIGSTSDQLGRLEAAVVAPGILARRGVLAGDRLSLRRGLVGRPEDAEATARIEAEKAPGETSDQVRRLAVDPTPAACPPHEFDGVDPINLDSAVCSRCSRTSGELLGTAVAAELESSETARKVRTAQVVDLKRERATLRYELATAREKIEGHADELATVRQRRQVVGDKLEAAELELAACTVEKVAVEHQLEQLLLAVGAAAGLKGDPLGSDQAADQVAEMADELDALKAEQEGVLLALAGNGAQVGAGKTARDLDLLIYEQFQFPTGDRARRTWRSVALEARGRHDGLEHKADALRVAVDEARTFLGLSGHTDAEISSRVGTGDRAAFLERSLREAFNGTRPASRPTLPSYPGLRPPKPWEDPRPIAGDNMPPASLPGVLSAARRILEHDVMSKSDARTIAKHVLEVVPLVHEWHEAGAGFKCDADHGCGHVCGVYRHPGDDGFDDARAQLTAQEGGRE